MNTQPATGAGSLDALADVSAAVESGAGLPEVARATGRALNASVAVVDSSSSVLAVACASPDDERDVLAVTNGAEMVELKVADQVVGRKNSMGDSTVPPAEASQGQKRQNPLPSGTGFRSFLQSPRFTLNDSAVAGPAPFAGRDRGGRPTRAPARRAGGTEAGRKPGGNKGSSRADTDSAARKAAAF